MPPIAVPCSKQIAKLETGRRKIADHDQEKRVEDHGFRLKPGANCWRIEQARRAAVLIDGENYFRAVRQAMMRAEERIVMMGWDFDTRIKMYDTQGEVEGPLALGDFIEWLVARNPDLHIYIIRWNMGIFKSLFRRANLRRLVKWMLHRRIHLKLDGKHPVGAAQHQKVIAIDRDTAFCGGLDITNQRWDTRSHAAREDRRAQPDGIDFGPWHDVAMIVQGPVAGALADFAESRFAAAAIAGLPIWRPSFAMFRLGLREPSPNCPTSGRYMKSSSFIWTSSPARKPISTPKASISPRARSPPPSRRACARKTGRRW